MKRMFSTKKVGRYEWKCKKMKGKNIFHNKLEKY